METKFKKCDAQTRALEVERRIWELVDAGKLTLHNGVYQRDCRKTGSNCHACAVGSAAMAVCGVFKPEAGSSYLRSALSEKGVMTHAETYAMERGFEAGYPWGDEATREMLVTAKMYWPDEPKFEGTCEENPFYRLGLRLKARKRPE